MMFDVQHRDCYDSLEAMREAGGCDLILTSPPYPDARKPEAYGAEFDTSLEGYGRLGDAVFEALKPGGVCALNIDGPVRKWRGEDIGSERSLIAFEVALDWAKRIGFRYVERGAYVRMSSPVSGGGGNPRWRSGFELIHIFARPGATPYFDRYGATRVAKCAGLKIRSGGTRARWGVKRTRGAVYVQPDRRALHTAEPHNGGSTDNDHPAPFLDSLADDYVLCYSPPGSLVGDPFVGSGTVAFSVYRAEDGRRFIGGDLGTRQTTKVNGRKVKCGRRWADIVNDGLRQQRLFL